MYNRFRNSVLLIFVCISFAAFSQNTNLDRPKLVVGIVVDQMRYDYIFKYWNKYSDNGFRRLVKEGFNCANTQYDYVPTYTGPGHAAIYTGTTPAGNGIIANEWYDRNTKKEMYVVADSTVKAIGGTDKSSPMSPKNLRSSTITDELKLHTNMRSKVVGVCIKDRGSVLPAGHLADAAYWYDGETGNWISSTYYMQKLPDWVVSFNNKKLGDKYLEKKWETLYPIETYTESLPDDQPYKLPYKGEDKNRFPHDLPKIKAAIGYEALRKSPFGNSYTIDFATEILKQYSLGKGNATDFLAMSLSSTDYVGHQFGVHAIETEDTYLRLDIDLGKFLQTLDREVGKGNYVLFLSADHGGANTPKYLADKGFSTGYFVPKTANDSLKAALKVKFGSDRLIEYWDDKQLYFNYAEMKSSNVNRKDLSEFCISFISKLNGIKLVVDLADNDINTLWHGKELRAGYYPSRSGDLAIVLDAGWYETNYSQQGGTTHGTGYRYDTHVPLLWYGWKIPHGESVKKYSITDIAPTLASLLHIMEPDATVGVPIEALFAK